MDPFHPPTHLDPSTVAELESIRGKLQQLQDSFNYLFQSLDHRVPIAYPDLLNKFRNLTAKFYNLNQDLLGGPLSATSQSQLPKLVLHIQRPPSNDQQRNVLEVMLRTKLIPEIERLEAATSKDVEAELGDPVGDQTDVASQLQYWARIRAQHDAVAEDANRLMQGLLEAFRDAALAGPPPREVEEKAEPEWKREGFPNEEQWRRYQLESMITFYSCGMPALADSELKPKKGGVGVGRR